MDWQALADAALAARRLSYCPYSRFAVGAALLVDSGEVFSGCNVENRSYGLTICAERAAVASAVAAGHVDDFVAIAIAAESHPPARPCGMCLDTLAEFAPDLPVLLVNTAGVHEQLRLSDLLTQPFRFPVQ